MSCEYCRQLMSGYIDNELSVEQREQLEDHLLTCDACKRELEEFVAIKEHLTMIKFKEPSDAELARYWNSVYNRLERGAGWLLFSLGAIILLCYGAFKLIEEIALLLKIGVISLIFGSVALFVSLVRERLTLRKTDKYSREVER